MVLGLRKKQPVAWLHYQHSDGSRKTAEVARFPFRIGRGRGNDLSIEERSLSKRHCQLRLINGALFLDDLGSMAGCWFNDERIVSHGPVQTKDQFRIGDLSFTLELAKTLQPEEISGDRSASKTASVTFEAETEGNDEVRGEASGQHEGVSADKALVVQSQLDVDLLSEWQNRVHEQLIEEMDLRRKNLHTMADAEVRAETGRILDVILEQCKNEIPDTLPAALIKKSVLDEAVGLGPLEDLIDDDSVTEIMVNHAKQIYVERDGRLLLSKQVFSGDAAVLSTIDRIITKIGRRIDESSPMVDARLPDGSRVNAIIPPVAIMGPSITIRKFPKKKLQFSDLINYGSVDEKMVNFLKLCVHQKRNIVVSGGTGTGKTTLLNVLSNEIPHTDRVVTVEDAAELRLTMPNRVALESRPENAEGRGKIAIRDLVRNALRMRPDRIVVGECRGGEALDMLQAMNTGHDGSLTTAHANSSRDALSRLEVMVMMSGMDLPILAIREQIASAVQIIVQQTRYPCGSRKITAVSEITGMESGTIQMHDLFVFRQRGIGKDGRVMGHFAPTGVIPTFYEHLAEIGVEVDRSIFLTADQLAEQEAAKAAGQSGSIGKSSRTPWGAV
ncbi:ATPase, T2SS/T4P/T4SS family [Allohahella sp. A8]|uniref:ATPase, T2SS/T4P/T4SS family n=1 Tax=Allohahella sp. A8 TaxID=3141461 RepID=UPI003A7F6C3F